MQTPPQSKGQKEVQGWLAVVGEPQGGLQGGDSWGFER